MKMGYCWLACVCLAGVAAAPAHANAANAKPVDVALVLAIDVSGSVDEQRYQLQRTGYAEAFAASDLIDAVASGENRAIAVTLVEWSGTNEQEQMVGWTLISDPASAQEFRHAVEQAPRAYSDLTSISGAIDYSLRLLQHCPYEAARQVIDISGDGTNNNGRDADAARDAAVAANVTINGLPILTESWDLDHYYHDHVIGGASAFVIPAKDFSDFGQAIRNKLVREIASRPPSQTLAFLATRVP